nr:N-acetylmuramoyl-L-alanine amidase [Bdellovibrionales bacterium]
HKSYLKKTGRNKFSLNAQFFAKHTSGFSIFVSSQNPQFEESVRLARLVAQKLLSLGRVPSTHHAEDLPSEGYKYIDPELGIYNSRFLVLRETQMPAILIEVGMLGDCEDLQIISSAGFRRSFSLSLKRAIVEFFADRR